MTEQLITLRAAQTLTLLDVRNYRQQVWQVGEYGADGDAPPPPLPGLRADPAANPLSS